MDGSRSAPLLTLLKPSTAAAYTAAGFWGEETIYHLVAQHARATPLERHRCPPNTGHRRILVYISLGRFSSTAVGEVAAPWPGALRRRHSRWRAARRRAKADAAGRVALAVHEAETAERRAIVHRLQHGYRASDDGPL